MNTSRHRTPTRPRPSAGSLALVAGIVVVGVLADQATKAWALAALDEPRQILGGLLGLRLVYNSGAAFSLGESLTWLYTIVATLVAVVIVVALTRVVSRRWQLTLAVLLAGALGNLADRIFRPPAVGRGHVIDFIDYGPFVGNLADIWIVGAAVCLAALSLLGVPAVPARPPAGTDEPTGSTTTAGEVGQ